MKPKHHQMNRCGARHGWQELGCLYGSIGNRNNEKNPRGHVLPRASGRRPFAESPEASTPLQGRQAPLPFGVGAAKKKSPLWLAWCLSPPWPSPDAGVPLSQRPVQRAGTAPDRLVRAFRRLLAVGGRSGLGDFSALWAGGRPAHMTDREPRSASEALDAAPATGLVGKDGGPPGSCTVRGGGACSLGRSCC